MRFVKFHFIYLFAIFSCIFTTSVKAQGNHKFEHIDLPSEVEGSKANCIFEDSRGFIWFGFNSGLVLYDGYKGKVISCILENGSSQSFGPVISIIEDIKGNIWVGSAFGIFIYNPIKETSILLNDGHINGKILRSLNTTSKGEILIGTDPGLLIYNRDGTFLEQYLHQPGIENSLSNNVVRCVYEDQNENIWIGTYDKLNLLDRKQKKITQFKLQKSDSLYHSNNLILSIEQFEKKNDSILIIGTETGLCLFNTKNQQFKQYHHSENENSISNSVVKSIHRVDNDLWLGTDLGLNIFNLENQNFTNLYYNYNNSFSISNNVIWDIYLDSHRNLWIATDAGIDKVYLNKDDVLLNQFYKDASFFKNGVIINDFSRKKNGDIWIATQQGVFEYHKNKDSYSQFLPPTILHNKVKGVLCDQNENGLIWIVTSGGLNIYDSEKKKFLSYVSKSKGNNVLTSNYLTCIAQDSKGNIWIGSSNHGLFKINKIKNGELEFINFKYEPNNNNSLSSSAISDITFDENDNVWVATGNGVNCFYILNGVFERFKDVNTFGQAPNSFVNQLFFDKEKFLWISSHGGLFQLSPVTKKFTQFDTSFENVTSAVSLDTTVYFIANNKFYYFDKNDKEVIRVPNHKIGLKNSQKINLLSDETLLLSGRVGFASLKANDLKIEKDSTKIKWTHFSISNTEIKPYLEYNSRFILNKHIDATDAITLNYDENSFRVDFSSLPFNSKKDVEYQYILENYESEWSVLNDGQNYVSYTQVRPGNYKLKVKASNNQGIFNSQERVLNIIVKTPIYLSFWALLIYLGCFILLILFYKRIVLNRERDKSELKFEKLEHQKSEELIALKTRFFTNITHELKTPLTLISSPVDDLLTKPLDEATLNSLSLVKRNADRLKKLVNQILDIRKIEAGGEKLRIQKYDIVKFCKRKIEQFNEESTRRNIFLQFTSEIESEIIWFDLEKVEKIIYNLLSNAFKFTPDNGTIKVHIEYGTLEKPEDNYISISVSDTGSGISKEDQANIFDRFKSLSSPNYTNQKGTGIGLSLIHEYATLHNGTITFESVLNAGSKFVFSLPKDKSLLKNYEVVAPLIKEQPEKVTEEFENITSENEALVNKKHDRDKPLKALIVEDDTDMRAFLAAGLSTAYKVVEAEDGQQGFNLAIKELPDIIVSDLMMPNVDGLEFCKKLKADIRTSHIPFILLTAKSGMDSKITGIETGADDYIQKPFNLDLLTVRVKNLIKQRESLKKIYLQQQKLEPSEITVNSLDEKFLDELLAKIEMEMDNSELSVKLLSKLLGISSTNLYRKVKALTGQTANEFIRNIRLKRAAQLLKNEQLNVSEVMYMVGFTHRSYFTRCFKELFGVSPKSYGK